MEKKLVFVMNVKDEIMQCSRTNTSVNLRFSATKLEKVGSNEILEHLRKNLKHEEKEEQNIASTLRNSLNYSVEGLNPGGSTTYFDISNLGIQYVHVRMHKNAESVYDYFHSTCLVTDHQNIDVNNDVFKGSFIRELVTQKYAVIQDDKLYIKFD